MKGLARVLFRQRIKLDDYLIDGIDILRKLVELLLNLERGEAEQTNGMLDLELLFEDSIEHFLQSLDKKFYLPFYWEDMYEVYTSLNKIFATLQAFATEKRIYNARFSFTRFLELEDRILDNVRCFFQEYMGNRKYAGELLKNNQHELKDFVRLYYQGIVSISREQLQSHVTSRLLEHFLEINALNTRVHDLLQKILIGTNL